MEKNAQDVVHELPHLITLEKVETSGWMVFF